MRVPPNGVRFELSWPHVGTGVYVSTITYMGKFIFVISPPRFKTVLRSEPPWLNDKLKNLIKRRQCALAKRNMDTFRMLRNCVNRERKICRAKYYEAKVSHLRECKPSVWWKEVKKLSGMSPASETRDNTSKLLRHLGFSPGVLANYINLAFLTPMQEF